MKKMGDLTAHRWFAAGECVVEAESWCEEKLQEFENCVDDDHLFRYNTSVSISIKFAQEE